MGCCRGFPIGRGRATIWRLNPLTGALIWCADLGANALAEYVSGYDIYEVGASGNVRKLVNTGETWEIAWSRVLASTASVTDVEMSVYDGVLWVVQPAVSGGARFSRIDPADGTVLSSGQPSTSTAASHLYDAPGGAMNSHEGGVISSASGTLRQINSTFGVDASWATAGAGSGAAPIDHDPMQGWIVDDTSGTVVRTDEFLVEVDDSGTGGGIENHCCTSTLALGALTNQQSVPGVMQGYDFATWTEAWEMPTGVGATLTSSGFRRIEGNVVYAAGIRSGPQAGLGRFDSGVQTWFTDVFNFNVRALILLGDNILVGGSFRVTSGAPLMAVASYKKSDGSLNWSSALFGAVIEELWESGGNLYAVGSRVLMG